MPAAHTVVRTIAYALGWALAVVLAVVLAAVLYLAVTGNGSVLMDWLEAHTGEHVMWPIF